MLGIKDKKKGVFNSNKSDSILAEELNQFYLRFDSHDFTDELSKFRVASEAVRSKLLKLTLGEPLNGQMWVKKS